MRLPRHTDTPDISPWSEIPAFKLIDCQLGQVRQLVGDCLVTSNNAIDVRPLLDYVTTRCGKMIRPGLVLLGGGCCGKITEAHIRVAAIVEMVHNATLLHDDVIDDGQTRRGVPTINNLRGNECAVLMGDYMLSQVFRMSADLDPDVAKVVATIAVRVCEGELRQVVQKENWQLTEPEYIDIITEKSAAFFSGCCRLGAILAGAADTQIQAITHFGLNSGIAFQITDDLLDITGDENRTGKAIDSDVAKSKLTLPVIHLLSVVDGPAKRKVCDLLSAPGQSKGTLKEMLISFGSLGYARCKAQEFVAKAVCCLDGFPRNPAKKALIETAQFMADRAI